MIGFSTGANLSSANTDRTAGGECLDGLRLAVYVRGRWGGWGGHTLSVWVASEVATAGCGESYELLSVFPVDSLDCRGWLC